MKTIIAFLLAVALWLPMGAIAAPQQGAVVHVGVDGMVCDFCAQSLKKEFAKNDAVQKTDISLEKRLVTLHLKPGKEISDADIKKVVDWAGYKVSSIHRPKEQKND